MPILGRNFVWVQAYFEEKYLFLEHAQHVEGKAG
jgi:hypothetical protein